MAVRKASDSNLTGKKYNDGSAGGTKIADVVDSPTPGTPTLTYVTASVPFTTRTTGGTATSYTVTSTPGSITASGASSPIAIPGLSDGTTYTFKVKGTNADSVVGPESDASSSVTTATYPASVTDTFNRTTAGNLGTTSTGDYTWENIRGTWYADGSQAKSDNTASDNSVAGVFTAGTTISNAQVDTVAAGGVGVAFWITDANSYYAATVFHSTSSGTTTTCTGGCTQTGGYCATCCASQSTFTQYNGNHCCCNGYCRGYSGRGGACDGDFAFYCQVSGRGDCGCSGSWAFYYTCTANQVNSFTNYISNFKLINNGTALVNTQYNTNTSAYSSAGSIAVSTSGDVITYTVYSAANKGGSSLHSATYTATGATKGRFHGIFKGDGGSNQGSVVDNFSVAAT